MRNERLSVYLHVPFCAGKCGYCSFYSEPPEAGDVAAYLDALAVEIALWRGLLGPLSPRTLYVGGGTPSLLSPDEWGRLIALLEGLGDWSRLEEATVEANPSSLSDGLLNVWRASFFTRVSLGVQSLDDAELETLGRRHDARLALEAMERLARSGLRMSVDLIFGIPGQTLRSWAASLRGVLDAGARHVSAYQLTLEPDTPMGLRSPVLPDGYPLYRYTQWFLPRRGFTQYEISSYAPPGGECRHNLAYWRQEDVLALGPAAWGYLEGRRYANPGTLDAYLEAAGRNFPEAKTAGERLGPRARGVEAAILSLRTQWGIDRVDFAERWGGPLLEEIEAVLMAIPPHLVRADERSLALTPAGMRVGNAIWSEFLCLL